MSEKKVVGKKVAIALGIIRIVLVVSLVGVIANYTLIISEKDNIIATKDSQISTLQNQISTLQNYYGHLSDDVSSLNDFLCSFAFIPNAFKRTLNDAAIRETAGAVNSAGVSRRDPWSSYERIYNWITSNIKYVHDVEMPYLNMRWLSVGEHLYVTGFNISTTKNYVQTPKLTLEIKQGDCDDQAILAYAMIKYYMKYVSGAEHALYIACITFNSGSAHLALFLPVQGGKLRVIDPAGNYLTRTSKPALSELQSYSSYWSSERGINKIVLYDVDVVDGSYTVIAEGNISEVASIFT